MFQLIGPTSFRCRTSRTSRPGRAGCTWPSSSTITPGNPTGTDWCTTRIAARSTSAPLHRAAGRSRYRALSGKPRRQLRQRAGRDVQWDVQGRVDPPARAEEVARGGGDRHAELGVLVQPSSIDGGPGLHPASRSRGKLLPATHRATRLGELTTYPNQPPRFPGRFICEGSATVLKVKPKPPPVHALKHPRQPDPEAWR